jgi:hypothetical protein
MKLTDIMRSLFPPLKDRFANGGTTWSSSFYAGSSGYRSFDFTCYECNVP